MRLRPLITVVALIGALSLTACDDTSSASGGTVGDPATPSGGASVAEPSTSPAPTAQAPTTPSAPPTTGPGTTTGAGATPPGTELTYGDPAVVEVFASGNPKARVEYTVTGVKMSTKQSFGPVALITIEVRAIDDLTDALALAIIDWDGVDELGNTTVFGVEEGCDDELPVEKAGETGTMCVAVSLTGEGTRLTAVQYGSGSYRDNPITWRP